MFFEDGKKRKKGDPPLREGGQVIEEMLCSEGVHANV
jgi:hypothetical protein